MVVMVITELLIRVITLIILVVVMFIIITIITMTIPTTTITTIITTIIRAMIMRASFILASLTINICIAAVTVHPNAQINDQTTAAAIPISNQAQPEPNDPQETDKQPPLPSSHTLPPSRIQTQTKSKTNKLEQTEHPPPPKE